MLISLSLSFKDIYYELYSVSGLKKRVEFHIIRVHMFVSGRVQGVNYRRDIRIQALKLGLTGWVRNLPDRRVELVAEGEEERVGELIRWCRNGPPLAIVRGLEVQRETPTGEFETFNIRR